MPLPWAALGDSAKTAFVAAMLAVAVGVLIAWLTTGAERRRRRQRVRANPAPRVVAPQPLRPPEPPAPVPPVPEPVAAPEPEPEPEAEGPAPPADDPAVLHLNRASYEELRSIDGVDPLLAARIIAYRREHGSFASLDEIASLTGLPADALAAAGGRRVVL